MEKSNTEKEWMLVCAWNREENINEVEFKIDYKDICSIARKPSDETIYIRLYLPPYQGSSMVELPLDKFIDHINQAEKKIREWPCTDD
jgi:hypothetical protein